MKYCLRKLLCFRNLDGEISTEEDEITLKLVFLTVNELTRYMTLSTACDATFVFQETQKSCGSHFPKIRQ